MQGLEEEEGERWGEGGRFRREEGDSSGWSKGSQCDGKIPVTSFCQPLICGRKWLLGVCVCAQCGGGCAARLYVVVFYIW